MSNSDVFRRVGRGGAGNFYSKKDVEDVENATAGDVEAQLPTEAELTKTITAANLAQHPAPYSKGGRGGAGNFYDAASTAASAQTQHDEVERTKAAVAASIAAKAKSGAGYYTGGGRGGAGNYGVAATTTTSKEEAEQKKAVQEELELRVLKEVEESLGKPLGVYTRPGAEKKDGDDDV